MTWKILNKSSPGTGTKFGADQLDKVNKYVSGVADPDGNTVSPITQTSFQSGFSVLNVNPAGVNYVIPTNGQAFSIGTYEIYSGTYLEIDSGGVMAIL